MNRKIFARKVRDYERLLRKPFWHLFEVAEYASGITNLDMFEYVPPVLVRAFELETIPVGSNAYNFDEEQENICINNYDCILRIIYGSIRNDEIESYPIKMHFHGRSPPIEKEFPHLKTYNYFVRPLEVLYLLVTEGIIFPKELQLVLRISQISNAGIPH